MMWVPQSRDPIQCQAGDSNVRITWIYMKDPVRDANKNVFQTLWYHNALAFSSTYLIATTMGDSREFVYFDQRYRDRLQTLGPPGFRLMNVTLEDAGEYSVLVRFKDGPTYFVITNSGDSR